MIVCAAVLGQTVRYSDHSLLLLLNNPLYLEVFQSKGKQEDALKFHYIMHCALDAVEEKVAAPRKAPGEVFDTYLGMLYPTEDFKVYGSISNTRIKFMLVVDEMLQKEDEMRMIFKRFHTAYVDAVSNPFYTTSTSVTSKRFDASVRTLVTSLGAS
ncbi:MAG: trafficking particle complex subunit 2 -like [Trebouxia sp. A1-2]|nr:MAG: trafficking particle complex subunit 2 -like [Trebouxia sp. A1-2]